jgi:two-component system chemotaxis sensor kinase CheA
MADERFFDEFAEDFFAEASDHLATMRRALLTLEDSAQRKALVPPQLLRDLLRSLHTLKGLCGMVGLGHAAALAHAVEESLRQADLEQSVPGAGLAESMFSAARALEQSIAAYRAGDPAPDVATVITELRALTYVPDRAASGADDVATPANYTFTFTPSPELNARGVTVEVVRTRLQSLGRVLGVVPRVDANGAIKFEFQVAAEPGREPDETWQQDGMAWRIEPAALPVPAQPLVAVETLARSNMVRVEVGRLDELMLQIGELVMSRARLHDAVGRLRAVRSNAAIVEVEEANDAIERQLRDLRGAVMRVRLVRVGEVFERMRFVARDVASETARQVRIEVEGGSTEIDKIVVERMLEPLLHLVRNAISHGIESPAERTALGKDPIGVLRLRAESAGDEIVMHVEDDGRGIDIDEIRRVARQRGLPAQQIEQADHVLDILSLPGFSTQDVADLASGRGVGMAVVRSTISELGGQLAMTTEVGRGTSFSVRLPLTLMIVDALLVEVADQIIAVPQPSLREVLQLEGDEITTLENNELMSYRAGVLPLVRLRSIFAKAPATRPKCNVLVVGGDTDPVGLVVDRIRGLREIVVRSLADPLVAVPGIAGAAELSDGTVTLILDTAGLVRYARERKRDRQVVPIDFRQQGRSA